jgi:hypothetical protein
MKRGTFQFETNIDGNLTATTENVQTLRKLWLDRTLVRGYSLGPGDEGDFDNGAWHVSCHLAGAGGVMRAKDGRLLWLEISHNPAADEYYASVTVNAGNAIETHPLSTAEGRALTSGATLLGFVEGNSTGHISAREVNDPPTLFNRWRRQSFDRDVDSSDDGGKVWEHWCTLRDIRSGARIGQSVLTAYVWLVAALGDRFAPTVARGRRDYAHPDQLKALVIAGFVSPTSALWDISPVAIPERSEALFLEAVPGKSLEAASQLDWSRAPCYFMFERRIGRWNRAAAVANDLRDIA